MTNGAMNAKRRNAAAKTGGMVRAIFIADLVWWNFN